MPVKSYGIWNTTTERWATDSEGIVLVLYTRGAAEAQLRETASRIGSFSIDAQVAEIGEDGEPLEVET